MCVSLIHRPPLEVSDAPAPPWPCLSSKFGKKETEQCATCVAPGRERLETGRPGVVGARPGDAPDL